MLLLQAIILLIYPFCDNYTILMICSGLSGALIAPFQIGMAIIVGEMLPIEKVASVSESFSTTVPMTLETQFQPQEDSENTHAQSEGTETFVPT